MFPKLRPADELAMIRAQIKTLELREAELRKGFLDGQLDPNGHEVSIEVKAQERRTFLRERLSNQILDDPSFWTVKVVHAVVVRKLGDSQRDAIRRFSHALGWADHLKDPPLRG